MYGINPGIGAPAAAVSTLAMTGLGDVTLPVIAAVVAFVLGTLLLVRERMIRQAPQS